MIKKIKRKRLVKIYLNITWQRILSPNWEIINKSCNFVKDESVKITNRLNHIFSEVILK